MPTPLSMINTSVLPSRLANAIERLVSQDRDHGAASTLRDTRAVTKEWYTLLGQILIAEYLNIGAPSRELNRYVFDAMDHNSNIRVGQWIKLSRSLHQHLASHWAESQLPAWKGLKEFSFGEEDDPEHSVTQVTAFQDNLGHVTFSADAVAFENIHQLISEQIQGLIDDFTERPICYLCPKSGTVMALRGLHPEPALEQTSVTDDSPHSPWIPAANGQALPLAPALELNFETGEISLAKLDHWWDSETQFQFSQAFESWKRESQGHVQFEDLVPQEADPAPHQVKGLEEALAHPDQGITLIEYRPGTGQKQLAGRLLHSLRAQAPESICWRIMRTGHPGSNAAILTNAILRQAEAVLGIESDLESKSPLDYLDEILPKLHSSEKRLGLIIMDAGRILEDAELSKPDFDRLFHSCTNHANGINLILLDHLRLGTRLPHDGPALQAPITEPIDKDELREFLNQWLQADALIRQNLLGLFDENTPQNLATFIAQLTEKTGQAPFPPQVEHALWEASPILERKGDTWQIAEPLANPLRLAR